MPIQDSPNQARAKFGVVLVAFLLLMALAHGAAELNGAPQPGHPGLDPVTHYRVIFTIWVTFALLTPALCLYILSRSEAASNYWRAFWTFSYLALLSHLFWTVVGTYHGDFETIFNSADAADPWMRVGSPGLDLFLAAWWGLDVLLCWCASETKWIRIQRGAVHLLTFVVFLGAALTAGPEAHLLGVVMLLCVSVSAIVRAQSCVRTNRSRRSVPSTSDPSI